MKNRGRMLVFGVLCFVLLSAGDCEFSSLGDILNQPGTIVVTNTGTEPAVVAIIADDVKSYPTLVGGASASAPTNIGGRYTVTVTMTAQQVIEYRADLLELRRTVERLLGGSASSDEKVYLFTKLAGIKAALSQLNSGVGASCSGNIKISQDNAASVSASVAWVRQSGSGFWEVSCSSN